MASGQDSGIVDQSAVGMRVATFTAGVWLTYVVCGSSSLYLALTWQRPHRSVIVALFGAGLAAAVFVSQLPREQIVRSRFREAFFLSWSLLDLVLITLGTSADGGTGSPLALTFFIPVVFSAMSYPLSSVAAVGGLSVAAYLALAVAQGGASWGYQALFAVMLLCTGAMSAWQARNHGRQRSALIEVSRADPLTGCLNRRGFEERALAQMRASARHGRAGAVLLLDVDHLKLVNDGQGHAAGDELLRWVVTTLESAVRPDDAIGRLGGDEFAVLFAEIDADAAARSTMRITAALSERAPCSVGLARFPLEGADLDELSRVADGRLYASRHGRSDPGRASSEERLSWAATLAHAVDMRMNTQHEHSRAVAASAVSIAAALGWDEEMLGMLRIAAMLHDVGKVTVPDSILCKPGRLSEEEYEVIRGHSIAGAELVAGVAGLEMIVPWIRHSHESFDGSGYPDGLRGEAIPQASRIMLVADAYDAMTSSRPYRAGCSTAHACEELQRHSGTQFDPACVAALLDCLSAAPAAPRAPRAVV
ncbi:MAG TPA: diguanylate cyclase [Solirubrobacteraceae bacterium]|nr:diguanylate cyclase [Solirubrobacteraceae bacterium]